MNSAPHSLPAEYHLLLEQAIARPNRNRLAYFTEYREYQSSSAPLRGFVKEEEAEYVELSTGERIRLDRIISLDGTYFPGYEDYDEALGARCSL